MTKQQFESKKKDFKAWARNDAKYYLMHKERLGTINEYFASKVGVYNKDRLMTQFNYTAEEVDEIINWYNECFWEGYHYWEKKFNKIESDVKQGPENYEAIFKEAEELAKKVDVSDIEDGFPCGGCHLYLDKSMQKEPIGKFIAMKQADYDSEEFKYELPIQMPSYGQCVSFDDRICDVLKDFLDKKGIPTHKYTFID